MFESSCALAEKYNQGNGTLVHRQVVNAINETKFKIDRRESLSAADESERMSAAEKLISSVRFLKSHAMSIFLPGIKVKHNYYDLSAYQILGL